MLERALQFGVRFWRGGTNSRTLLDLLVTARRTVGKPVFEMSFYIRKSLRFGPLRINLSGSGVGVSAGVKGLRVGSGPRGNYIHAGVGGLYYRKTLSRPREVPAGNPTPDLHCSTPVLTEIESGDALAMVDQGSSDLLAEINTKQRLTSSWPFAILAGTLALGLAVAGSVPNFIVVGLLLFCMTLPSVAWDRRRKTTVLFYELQAPVLGAVEALHRAFERLAASERIWHVEAEGRYSDTKYSAGAETSVRRRAVRLMASAPPYFKTNVPVLCIPVGRQRLYLLPDRILVFDSQGVGAVAYRDLEMRLTAIRFVETNGAPRDAVVVDHTWRYVNKGGGPDRRFRFNPELPIALYDELHLKSSSGLNEVLQVSRREIASELVNCVRGLAAALCSAPSSPVSAGSQDLRELPPNQPGADPEPASANALADSRTFYYFQDTVEGPFTASQLRELLETGAIQAHTQVCSSDENRWKPYTEMFAPNN